MPKIIDYGVKSVKIYRLDYGCSGMIVENQGLKKELNETKRELHKKEKALAELAVLHT